MTHASLFSGIGGAEIAATWMGWTNLFHCEINPFGRKVLEYWYPNSTSYEDITKTDFTPWRGRIDVLTAGFPCFVAGTPVLTRRGFIPIDEVQIGDEVLTTDRTYHPVECTMKHSADKIVRMRAQGMWDELKCTPNHPFYVRRRQTYYEIGVGKIRYLQPEYVKASEIRKGDKVGFPIFEGADTSNTKAFWKLVGAWIADGWIQDSLRSGREHCHNHKVIICCGKKNISRLHHIIQAAGYRYTLSEDKSTFRCIICDKWLCGFLKDFGKYAHGKHLSPQCFMLDRERKKALLEGWFADGYKKTNGAQCVTTVSERLALDMAQIARDVYLCPVSISKKSCNRICVIEGREVNERPQYCVTISDSNRYGFYEDGFVWCNVKSIIEEQEINEVYNLSVNEEHSYNVYGIAVHNCQPFSVAGQRKGADDDRYLWPQVVRAVREIRPAWVVGENVAGILTMVQPGEEVEVGSGSALFDENHLYRTEQQYVLETVCQDLEREGYSVQPFVIPACAVGAPHRRDRVWIVARRIAADTSRNGDSGRPGAVREEVGRQDYELRAEPFEHGGLQTMAASDTDEHRHTSCRPCEGTERSGRGYIPQQEEWGNTSQRPDRLPGLSRDASHASRAGWEKQHASPEPVGQAHPAGMCCEELPADRWAGFPTQPPVCNGDDGLSLGLAGITFPRWRAEAIKALGNAMVPAVVYEIFRAIQQAENK